VELTWLVDVVVIVGFEVSVVGINGVEAGKRAGLERSVVGVDFIVPRALGTLKPELGVFWLLEMLSAAFDWTRLLFTKVEGGGFRLLNFTDRSLRAGRVTFLDINTLKSEADKIQHRDSSCLRQQLLASKLQRKATIPFSLI
jgi:hypothetical protein